MFREFMRLSTWIELIVIAAFVTTIIIWAGLGIP